MMFLSILALVDSTSASYRMGEIAGAIIGIALMVAIPVFFIYALVQYFKTKRGAWLVGALLSGVPVGLFVALFIYGFYQGVTNASKYTDRSIEVPEDNVLVTDDGLLQVKIPGHWKLLRDLNNHASLQAGNLFKEEYFVCVSISKEDFGGSLLQQADLTVRPLVASLEGFETDEVVEFEVNGMTAVQYEARGVLNNISINYLNTIVEDATHFHQIYCWTLRSKRDRAFPVFRSVIETLRAPESI